MVLLLTESHRGTSLKPSGSTPLAPYASLTSTSGPSARTVNPFPFFLLGDRVTESDVGPPSSSASNITIPRPFLKESAPRPSPTSESARAFDRVRLAGESDIGTEEWGWFSLPVRCFTGVTRLRFDGDGRACDLVAVEGSGRDAAGKGGEDGMVGEEKISICRLEGAVRGGGGAGTGRLAAEESRGFALTLGAEGLGSDVVPSFALSAFVVDEVGKPLTVLGWTELSAFRRAERLVGEQDEDAYVRTGGGRVDVEAEVEGWDGESA